MLSILSQPTDFYCISFLLSFTTLLSQKISPYIIKELSFVAQSYLTSSSCTPAPTASSQHPCKLSLGLSCLEKIHFNVAISDLWLFAKHENDCNSHFQNTCKHLAALLCSVWRWALSGLYSPHLYIMQFKEKKSTSHTLFWVLFFPFLG